MRPIHARRLAAAMTMVLAVGLATGLEPLVALADPGPTVPLPTTPSVPVTPENPAPRPPDEATNRELHGNQPPGAGHEGSGSFAATPLAPSASWNVSAQTGGFTWSYPLRVPPAPGGLAPQLALSYSSSAVDGRTTSTNNQPSWIGDGWDLNPGFVERTYGGCADDKDGGTTPPRTGDLCWKSDNATAAYGSGGGMLINGGAAGWRVKNDDGSRVERLTGAGNAANGGEYWKITTVDGTQYFFGSRPESGATWTVPVFGDDVGEPCHGNTFDTSHCVQGWRWNLDKVVDRHGNVVLYSYDTEANNYGLNLKDAAVSYIRGGTLRRIEYGLHTAVNAPASGRVEFTTADRCVRDSQCTFDKKDNWPDTALDERCDTPTCKDHYSPTFWTTKRLASISTQVLRGSSYTDVDRWTLDQQFPDPGDGEKAALWLKSITHTGLVGGSITLPPVLFEGHKMPNRVYQQDNFSPVIRYRIVGIISEAGGFTSINYAPPECTAPPTNPESNTLRCFPVRWSKKDWAERTDYFHKYVVESVVQSDRVSANPQQVTNYEYLGGAAWHYDTSEFTPADKKSWNEFRGFGQVRIRKGVPNDPAGPITLSEQRFYRGMHGDHLPSGTRTVTITDSEGGSHPDEDWLSGFGYESTTHNGDGGPIVSKTITDPSWQGPTASRGDFKAYIVAPGTVRTFAALDAGRGWRTTRTETGYDDRGQPTQVNDLGDTAISTDDKCTRSTYVRNADRWIITLPSRVETVSVACERTPAFPADAIADVRTSYDEQAAGAAPIAGDVTKLEHASDRPAAGPVYTTAATAKYDVHGRVIQAWDALGRTTKAAYTPATGGPTTQTVATNALGHNTTTTIEPAFGQSVASVDANARKTESTLDALGRITETWLPNRPRNTSDHYTGNIKRGYQVRNDAPSVVTTMTVGANGRYLTTNALYDGLLRERQTQAPAPGGTGRLLTDTRYDSQGRVSKTTKPYFNDGSVDTTLWMASEVEVPGFTTTLYDGAGRPTVEAFKGGSEEKWRTTTSYGGDRVSVTPPTGAAATTTITNARGFTTEIRQYHTPQPTGTAYDTTTYTQTASGQLATVRDPAGNVWEYRYNLRGRLVWSNDPDKGITTSTHDDAGQLLTQTDARSRTIAYEYDDLGRKKATHADSATGRTLGAWTYDTLPNGLPAKGMLATATSYDENGKAFSLQMLSYTALYLPGKTSIIVPDTGVPGEGLLAGTYTTTAKYNFDGSLSSETYPAVGNLPEETVTHTYDDFGGPLRTYGGPTGSTVEYALNTEFTRYGEVQRVHLGSAGKRMWLSHYYDDHTRQLARTIVDAEVPRPMQADVNYTYDPAGNVTAIADTVQDQPADTQCFRYDHLQRLTEAWTPNGGCAADPATANLGGPAPYWQSFGYDTVGNRLSETQHTVAGDTRRTHAYQVPGHAHALASTTTVQPGGTTVLDQYGYDAIGNTTGRNLGGTNQILDWDIQGRLAKITEGGKVTDFRYDAVGGRLMRRDPTAVTLYLGNQEIRLDRATGTKIATRYYAHGGELIAVRNGAGLSWLAADHQATAQISVNAQTLQVARRRQTPFGGPRGQAPAGWPGERGFVGGTLDASTGLTHLGAREYDPLTGRFLSVDPIMVLADPQKLNGYAYSENSPVTRSDPTGLTSVDDRRGTCGERPIDCQPAYVPDPTVPEVKLDRPHIKAIHDPVTKKNYVNYVQVPDNIDFDKAVVLMADYMNSEKHQRTHAFWTFDDPLIIDTEVASILMAVCGKDKCGQTDYGRSLYQIYLQTLGGGMIGPQGGAAGGGGRVSGPRSQQRSTGLALYRPVEIPSNVLKAMRCNSFDPDTEVLMADGSRKSIEDVQVGGEVLATDPETGRTGARRVVATIVGEGAKNLVEITVDTGTGRGVIIATDGHPFWLPESRAWKTAGELRAGSLLRTSAGTRVRITAVHTWTAQRRVHNLTVDGIHTYYVHPAGLGAEADVLVHNNGPCTTVPRFLTNSNGVTVDTTAVAAKIPGGKGIPQGWVPRIADNEKGVVWQRPGAQGNADMIRVMEPTSQHPQGYLRVYNSGGQPLDVAGRPGPNSATHIPLNYSGTLWWPDP